MWVRAQIDYLQRLPNDVEKRKALKQLPPDLPQTYVRIFETIDSSYPVQTATYIRRALKWLAFADEVDQLQTRLFDFDDEHPITCDALCQMICIGNERDWPPVEAVPTNRQIREWCGCLIRDTGRKIELSHFTVIEFLTLNADSIPSWRVHKYLITPGDEDCITSCLRCMTHEHFRHTALSIHSTESKVEDFLAENPLYKFLTGCLCYVFERSTCCGMREDLDYLLQRFFTVKPSPFLQLWELCNAYLAEGDLSYSPLQVACYASLVDQVTYLLNEGADPNCKHSSKEHALLPLPLSMCCFSDLASTQQGIMRLRIGNNDTPQYTAPERPRQRSLQVARALLESGASCDRQLSVELFSINEVRLDIVIITPLVLAVLCCNIEVASLLLSKGADWNAKAETNAGNSIDLCSIKGLLVYAPQFDNTIRDIAALSGNYHLEEVLDKCIEIKDSDSLGGETFDVPKDDPTKSQNLFVNAYRTGDWDTVRNYLNKSTVIDINRYDEHGTNAIVWASKGPSDVLLQLLEHGADPNFTFLDYDCALLEAVKGDCIENVKLLLRFGARVDQKNTHDATPFLYAVDENKYEALQILMHAGADVNATFDDGSNALLLDSRNEDEAIWSLLLDAGVDPNRPNNYGTRALHLACHSGHYSKVKQLIELVNEAADIVIQNSLIHGYPLYLAAKKGSCQIVELLLDRGAIIDQVGLGNTLGSALMAACAKGHQDVVELLLSRGAALEVEGSRFLSAAGTARAFKKTAILKILEEYTNTKEANITENPVEGAQDDVSEIVRSDHGKGKEMKEEEEAPSTVLTTEEDEHFSKTQ